MRSSKSFVEPELISQIRSRIRGRTAIAGIGNILRGDDGLGPKLIEVFRSKKVNASLFDCGTAPENYIFPMLSSACETVILVDAADLKERPGTVRVFDPEAIANVSFSTHNPSPRLFIDLLKTGKDGLNIFILSIQPKTTALGEPLSPEVERALDALGDAFADILA